jgi:hypothetical protein
MATVNLLPNADVSNDPAWTLSTGSDIWALLDDDATEEPNNDTNQITCTAAGFPPKSCIIQFTAFDDTNVDSIDSVQAVLKVGQQGRGHSYTIGMTITNNGSGAASWAEETINDTASIGWNTNIFTSRATSTSGGSDWNDTDIDGIAMEIHAHTMSGDTLRVTYAYFIVTYTAAVTVTDNATFFGANF